MLTKDILFGMNILSLAGFVVMGVPMPARGFLPRGLSDACPPSAPHCQVTGRRLITLNESGPPKRRTETLPTRVGPVPLTGAKGSLQS
jgi:hypothetical protein